MQHSRKAGRPQGHRTAPFTSCHILQHFIAVCSALPGWLTTTGRVGLTLAYLQKGGKCGFAFSGAEPLGCLSPHAQGEAQSFSDAASFPVTASSDSPPRLPDGEQKEQPGARRASKLTEDLTAHLVFLPLELFLQVKFLSLQITDGLPQLLGLVPVGTRAGWCQCRKGMWLTGSSLQGTRQRCHHLACSPQDGYLQAPCPDGDALARRRCQPHAWTRATGEVRMCVDMRVPRV